MMEDETKKTAENIAENKNEEDDFDPKFKLHEDFNGNPFSCRSCRCHP
jgi:hypothetical protein